MGTRFGRPGASQPFHFKVLRGAIKSRRDVVFIMLAMAGLSLLARGVEAQQLPPVALSLAMPPAGMQINAETL